MPTAQSGKIALVCHTLLGGLGEEQVTLVMQVRTLIEVSLVASCQKDKQIKIVKEGLGVLPGTIVIPFSSVTKQGRDEIWELVERNYLNTQENEE